MSRRRWSKRRASSRPPRTSSPRLMARARRRAVRNYVKRHKRLQETVKETVEHALDVAEHKLLGAVTKGNMTAVIFYLKTKGRERGYVQRWGYVDKNNQPSDAPSYVIELPYNGRDDPEDE